VITPHLTEHPSQQAVVEAALLMLRQMGLSPDDLVTAPRDRPPVPTFAEYIPVVSAAVTAGTRRAYGSYWNRVLEHWGERRTEAGPPTSSTGTRPSGSARSGSTRGCGSRCSSARNTAAAAT
jgi:hypothetical protein